MNLLPFTLGVLATTIATASPLPIEVVHGQLTSGQLFVSCRFDGFQQRCQLDTGATDTVVSGPFFKRYRTVGKTRHKGAANVAEVADQIVVKTTSLGPLSLANLHVSRPLTPTGGKNVIGMDLVGQRPFSLHFHHRPGLSWGTPALAQPQTSLLGFKGILALPLTIGTHELQALWDTGAGLSCIERTFVKAHPDDFVFIQDLEQGRDSLGHPVKMQLMLAPRLVVGGQVFHDLNFLAMDFTVIHQSLSPHVDAILGFNAIRRADWDFDPLHHLWAVSALPTP